MAGARMEESHFNSSPYFWPAVPTVSGQIDNSMFINKMKEQLLPAEKGCGLAPPHYPALLTVPTSVALPTSISMESDTKPEQLTPHSQAPVTQNITVVPVQSAGLMTTGPGLVITSPSGSLVTTASSVQTFPISAPMIVSALPPGSQAALQVVPDLSKKGGAALAEGGAVSGAGGITPKAPRGRKKKRLQESGLPEMSDPFVLPNEDDDDQHKDGKTYRWALNAALVVASVVAVPVSIWRASICSAVRGNRFVKLCGCSGSPGLFSVALNVAWVRKKHVAELQVDKERRKSSLYGVIGLCSISHR
ncbi:UNVERIFIED_CONTAM: hypothetical protein K2H54_024782 [Gekko kuhli]